jgi:hypothetical protein
MVPDAAPEPPPTCEIRGWAVFAPGYHKGTLYTPEDVARMAANFGRLRDHLTPRMGLGHDREKRLAASLGLPAAGRVTDARADADGNLVLDLDQVPTWLGGQINAGRFPGGSIECNPSAPDPDDPAQTIRGPVLTGIALLGEEQPAVKGLPPPVAVFADGTRVPPSTDPLPVPGEVLAAMSAAYRADPAAPTLCFSETPMPTRDEMNQQLQACGLDPAQYAGLSDDQLKSVLDGINGDQFAAAMKKKFADVPASPDTPGSPQTPPAPAPADDPNAAMMAAMKKCLSEELDPIKQRLGSVEKAYSDKQEEDRKGEEKQFSEKAERFLSGPQGGRRIAPALRPALVAAAVQATQTKQFSGTAYDTPQAAYAAWEASVLAQPESLMFADAVGPAGEHAEIGPRGRRLATAIRHTNPRVYEKLTQPAGK